jgi:hypothetical protein
MERSPSRSLQGSVYIPAKPIAKPFRGYCLGTIAEAERVYEKERINSAITKIPVAPDNRCLILIHVPSRRFWVEGSEAPRLGLIALTSISSGNFADSELGRGNWP